MDQVEKRHLWNLVVRSGRTSLKIVLAIAAAAYIGLTMTDEAPGQEPPNFIVPFPAPGCTPDQILTWADVRDNSLRIAGEDPVGKEIGCWPQSRFFNWSPVKQTLCGVVDDYFFYDTWGDEADWNLNTIPLPRYSYLIDEVKALGVGLHKPCGGQDCMQAEITPDNNYYENPWFPKSCETFVPDPLNPFTAPLKCNDDPAPHYNQASPLEGNTVCTYGPWVGDSGHGGRPEIHPAELLWWRSGSSAYLLLLQDDSNRFDRPGDFEEPVGCPGPKPDWWRPWSAFPRTGKFKLAFSLDPDLGPARFDIFVDDELHVRRDLTGPADVDDGTDHALVHNGKTLLTVREFGDDRNVQVGLEDVCQAFGRLLGFVTLTSSVGIGDRGGEGFQLLRVDETAQPGGDDVGAPVLTPLIPRREWLSGKVLVATLHPLFQEPDGNRPPVVLVADLEIQTTVRGTVSPEDLVVSAVQLVETDQRRELAFEQPSDTTVIVNGVPVAGGPVLELTMSSGKVLKLVSAAVSLAPTLAETALVSQVANSAWGNMVIAAGAQPLGSTPPATLVRVSQWQLQARPSYAPLKEGEPSPEDDSPVTEELNDVVASSDLQQIAALFGSAQPFAVEWAFQARNLTTGAEVPVGAGQAGPNDVLVQFEKSEAPNAKVKVTFPSAVPDDIFELTATATMIDTLGIAPSATRHRVWSHVLAGDGGLVEPLMRVAAGLAGVPPEALVDASRLDGTPSRLGQVGACPRLRRAALVRTASVQATRDGMVTVPELRGLIAGASQFASADDAAPGCIANRPPDCSRAAPSVTSLWPPNHQLVPVHILGVTDPDGDAVAIRIDSIFQDEPVNAVGSGNTCPDGTGVGTSTAQVRAERAGTGKVPGDGRVYHIRFTAADPSGAACSGEVTVSVPHDQGRSVPVDGGPLYDSTTCLSE